MKLHVITIALDAMPFLSWHLASFPKMKSDWRWHIVEGAAMNTHDTAWCKPQEPRHSVDGTIEYIDSIRDERCDNIKRPRWDGKVAMFNAVLKKIDEPCILMEIDADEFWQAWQLDAIVALFEECPDYDHAFFACNYFVGDRIQITSKGTYGDFPYEWIRAWRFQPGMKFLSHEPPKLSVQTKALPKELTAARGLVFDHLAYWQESQIAYKEQFYGYADAVKSWQRLQANTEWPVNDLAQFLPWVGPGVTANKI